MTSRIPPLAFAAGSDLGQSLGPFILPILIFAIFYFIVMAPMRKRQKALQQLIDNLKKGDRVITNGGMYGEVVAVDEAAIVLKVADNVKLKFAKSAIAGLQEGAGAERTKS